MDGSIFVFLFMAFAAVISLVSFGVWVWALVDAITNESSEGNDKIVWILVIVFAGIVGAAIYFFVRRPQRIQKFGK